MCGGSCGGNTSSVTTQNQPPAYVQSAFQNLINAGQNLAGQPLQQYGGPMVAGFTPQQQQAMSTIQNAQGLQIPYLNAAAQYMSSAATPIGVPGGLSASGINDVLGSGIGLSQNAAGAPVAASAQPYLNAANAGAFGASRVLNPALVNAGLGAANSAMGYAGNGLNSGMVNSGLNAANSAMGYAGNGFNSDMVNAGLNRANNAVGAAGTDIYGSLPQFNAQNIGQYLNPYTQDVVGATEREFNNQNAIQQNQLTGNAIAQGAFGGDRAAIAGAVLAGQQQQAEAPVLAGLEQSGYTQAAQEFQAEQQLKASTEAQRAALEAQTGLGAGQQYQTAAGLGLQAAGLGAQTALGAGAQYQQAAGLALQAAGLGAQTALGAGQQYQSAAGLGAQYGLGAAQLRAQTGLASAQQSAAAQQAQAALQQQAAAQMLGLGQGQQQASIGAQQASGWLGQNAGFGLASLGNQALNGSLTAASANLNAGSLQQQLAQEQLNIPYEQFLAQQAHPYQSLNFLSGLETGAGSLAGGFGSSTYPGPSALSQGLGAAMNFAGIAGETGGFGPNGWLYSNDSLNPGLLNGAFGNGNAFASLPAVDASQIPLDMSSFSSAIPMVKRGGRVHFDDGGAVDASGPPAYAASGPFTQSMYQNFASMPLERLQELAVQLPPASQQGQMVRRALLQKQMMPPAAQSDSGQPGYASGGAVNIGDAVTVTGLPQADNPAISYIPGSRGIAIPQLDAGALTASSSGLGSYMNPLPQMTGGAPPITMAPPAFAGNTGGLSSASESGQFGATPGERAAQTIAQTPGELQAQAAKNASSKSMATGLGSIAGGALGGAGLGSIVPGFGTAIGAVGGALAGSFASNLFRPNRPAINDIAAAQGLGRTITDAEWNQAGYGQGGAYLDPKALLTKAPGQKNNAPLRDIAQAISLGRTVSDADWAKAGLSPNDPYAQQIMTALGPATSAPGIAAANGLASVPMAAANPVGGLGAMAKRGGRVGFARYAEGGDVDDDGDDDADFTAPDAPQSDDDTYAGDAPPPSYGAGLGQSGPETGGLGETVNVSAPRAPQAFDYSPPPPSPWMALAQAGAATMAGRSPYALSNLGQGVAVGLKEYQREKDLDSRPVVDHSGPTVTVYYGKHAFDTGIPTVAQENADNAAAYRGRAADAAAARAKAEQSRADAAGQNLIESRIVREQQIAGQRKAREDTAAFRQQQLEQGRYTNPVPGTGKDADGNDVPGSYVTNSKTGEVTFHPGVVLTGKPGGGAGSGGPVAQWRYNAWLAIHPDDKQGALDYSAGHKQMQPADMLKYAQSEAGRQLGPGAPPDRIDARASQIIGLLRTAQQSPNAPAAANRRPLSAFDIPKVPNGTE